MVRPKKVPKHQWKDIFLHNTSANFILKILFIFAIANKGHSDFAFVQPHLESLSECFWHKELMNSVSEMGRSMIGTKKKKRKNKGMSSR